MFYDLFLVIALVALVNALALGLKVKLAAEPEPVLSALTVQLLTLTSVWGFFCLFWRKNGQTLGMQAWRIKLVDQDGQVPALSQLLRRCAGASVSLACLGLGYLWRFVDPQALYWHDRLSETQLILLPKGE
jgi:uncharacterized RDD family membrane protein YckC